MDVINWVLNQNELGTSFDVQNSIWAILEDELIFDCDTPCQDIYNIAVIEGQGFTPTVGEYMGIILEPEGNRQNLIIPILLEANNCDPLYQAIYRDETIWALDGTAHLFSRGWVDILNFPYKITIYCYFIHFSCR